MRVTFKGNASDLSVLFLAAERYALGRRTYMPGLICEIIKNNINLVLTKDINVMIRDIENAYSLGDKCDEIEWKKLLDFLKIELERRMGSERK